ncbi:sulfatase-like hydrolase/transferase [Micrococcales bacterium 31B]|nr:sulfatase-like hydrolase/transferase [Micrococcales bacterium 31B]
MADQHAASALGAAGDGIALTPHLDALFARGTQFTNAYCNSPICVPSRAALATGRYVHATGNTDNASPYLGSEAPSWGHALAAAGTPVTTFGKLHYRAAADDTGFADQRLPLHTRGGQGDLFHVLRDRQPPAPQLRAAVQATAKGESDYTQQDRAVAAAAGAWLEHEAPRDRPWACQVSFVTPHYPFTAPREYLDLYDPDKLPLPPRHAPTTWDRHGAIEHYRRMCGLNEPLTEAETRLAMQHYYALVSFMDAQVGLVLAALDASGHTDDTLVIYTSDHGELLGCDGAWFKSTLSEGSVRVPLALAGPGVAPGARCKIPVSLVDIFPTVLDARGLPCPPDLPGASLLNLARNSCHPEVSNRVVFSEYHSANSERGCFMVRRGDWKYIAYLGYPERLFNLAADPLEAHDRADDPACAATLASLRTDLATICDPELVDFEVRARQSAKVEVFGLENILRLPLMTHSPVPHS